MFSWYRVSQIVAIVLSANINSVCQALKGTKLAETVEDPTGAIVPSAKITLINNQTANAQSTLADEEGQFLFRRTSQCHDQAEDCCRRKCDRKRDCAGSRRIRFKCKRHKTERQFSACAPNRGSGKPAFRIGKGRAHMSYAHLRSWGR
jgi:hypothetical protein